MSFIDTTVRTVRSGGDALWRHRGLTFLCILGMLLLFEFALLPFGEIRALRLKNPTSTAFMRDAIKEQGRQGRTLNVRQNWIPLEKVPNELIDAVIVSEDGTFWQHEGFDWFEFRESLERNIEQQRVVRGASTITQQLVKNLFLSASKNPLRKLQEWALTWYMERTLTKRRILELYLNLIEWGRGIYGIEAASRFYFGKSAEALTRGESLSLAAIIPSPRRHSAADSSAYVRRRSNLILRRMEARGILLPDVDSADIIMDTLAPQNVEFDSAGWKGIEEER